MLGFIKKIFFGLLNFFEIVRIGVLLASNCKEPTKCISLNNQLCQTKPILVNFYFDETLPITVMSTYY